MTIHKIAVLPGDGIGTEIISEGVKVLRRIEELDATFKFEFEYFPWGSEYYLKTGEIMPKDGLDTLAKFDAIYFGACGTPGVPNSLSSSEFIIKIRRAFDQYVNLRPARLMKGVTSSLRNGTPENINIIFIRENTEGEYTDSGSYLYAGTQNELAMQNNVFSRRGCERVMRFAFELARKNKMHLTSITKSNAVNWTMCFWDKIFDEISKEYPDVQTYSCLVDAAAMYLVVEPQRFQVVVASNLFGDILTDLGAGIAGGLGLGAGANLNPERTYPSLFEPIHGSAPDIAHENIANPIATILAAGQMMDFLGYERWAKKINDVCEQVIVEGKTLTPDLGGTATTQQLGDAIIEKLK